MASSSLVLLSGGIESATLLYQEAAAHEVMPLFIDYAQKNAAQERKAAQRLSSALGLTCQELDMHRCGEQFRDLREQKWHVPLPHRNLPIVALAMSYATALSIKRICLSLNKDDLDAYDTATQAFITQVQQLAATLSLQLTTPLIHLSKAEVISLGTTLGVDYSLSYSCLRGKEPPCGVCPQCEHRRQAFADNGLSDPYNT